LSNYKTHVLENLICIEVIRLKKVYLCIFGYALDSVLCFGEVVAILVE